ncbi:MAG TPA: helix-turn-helix domain-containing protein [Tepidisphaeraceae bacterium]|nr:helix-turn-helix domain-containing protein [Tepidisphaeraceae bacterium]
MKRTDTRCPAERTLLLIGGKWKILILYHLDPGPRRFSELRRRLTPVTPRMLAQQLRQLEHDGIIRRKIYPQIPPRVDYSLTAAGRSLKPVIAAMCRWAKCR